MKALVVYYSFEGNTKFLAEKIAETLHADVRELTTSKQYPAKGLGKFFWGGKSVIFGEEPELTNGEIDVSPYDTVIIGTPVWASSYAPPLKTFLNSSLIQGKKIALFACHGGGGAVKCFRKLKEALPGNEFIGEVTYFEPKSHPECAQSAQEWAAGLLLAEKDPSALSTSEGQGESPARK